ncbi:DNA-binding transcriptional LysR family regulator [Friedmanniella endophytica]|uniref:DNA-binding transcriptional LysR family regulator n=1 Tax=Microlunatus kandeliicorticis TaxID=1759536 RepID=A0A7W3IPL2_9ACTN|nr:LysR family transcriptional regulator [Microlunatus kandeliicorticis]MBA8792903.1 DNA-binding transcriptional LysR family regulator [Microlunatus kandeliicorticis]
MELSTRMPDLTGLETFLAVARLGSINAAAHELGISQQATSARMAALEAQTGVQMLVRTARGSQLTPAGVVTAEWATRVISAAVHLDRGLATLRQDRQTRLRLAASLTVAELLLPGWLVSLDAARRAQGRSHVEVMLTAANSETVIATVRSGEADLGFVESPRVPRDIRSTVVAHDRLVLVARPDDRLARRSRPVTADELARTPLVSRETGSGTREALVAALRSVLGADTAEPPVILSLSTTSAVRSAVLAGAGPAALSELAVNDDVHTGRLARIDVDGLDLRRALRAVWLGPAKPPAGAGRDLVAHIQSGRR